MESRALVAGIILGVIIGGLGVLALYQAPLPQLSPQIITTVIRLTQTQTVTLIQEATAPSTQAGKWISEDSGVVSWMDAARYVGQTKTVEGIIVRTFRSGNAIFLDFHDPYQGYFMVVIFKSDWSNFKCQPEVFYKGKEIRVTGLIKTYQGSPEIIATSPTQIEVAYIGSSCQ